MLSGSGNAYNQSSKKNMKNKVKPLVITIECILVVLACGSVKEIQPADKDRVMIESGV